MTWPVRTYQHNPEAARTRRRSIPAQRARVLAFIKECLADNLPFPTYQQIADHMGWRHESSARHACETLTNVDRALRRSHHPVRGVRFELAET